MIVGSFSKLPGEKRDFLIDWTSRLSGADTIGTSTVTTDAGLTLSAKTIVGKTVTFFAEGGTAGTSYTVTNLVTTTAGLVLEAQIVIAVSSIVVGANSYATAADADSYHAARGNAAWMAGDFTSREAALIRASSYLTSLSWIGTRTDGRSQALAWPRTGVVDAEGNDLASDELPAEVRDACIEIALREVASPGVMAPDVTMSAAVKREKIGEIEVEYLGTASASSAVPVVTAISGLIDQFLVSPNSGSGSKTTWLDRA